MTRRYDWLDTKLGPGYHDPREVLLYAAMASLGRYIDEMGGLEKIDEFNADLRANPDPNAPKGMDSDQADRQAEAAAIWHWWTIERPADQARSDEMCHKLFGRQKIETKPVEGSELLREYVPPKWNQEEETLHKEFRALEEKIDNDEQKMLHRLVDIRYSLWT